MGSFCGNSYEHTSFINIREFLELTVNCVRKNMEWAGEWMSEQVSAWVSERVSQVSQSVSQCPISLYIRRRTSRNNGYEDSNRNVLKMEAARSSETLVSLQHHTLYHAFNGTVKKVHYCEHKRLKLDPILSRFNPVPRLLPLGLFPTGYPTLLREFSKSTRAACPAHLDLLDFIALITHRKSGGVLRNVGILPYKYTASQATSPWPECDVLSITNHMVPEK
jgi:hypothetical protein